MLNKEFLTSTGLSYNPYAQLHFAAKMRKLSTNHWIWEYSRDLENVVGMRVPWWIRDDNYLAKVEISNETLTIISNASWALVKENHQLHFQFYNHFCDPAGSISTFRNDLYVLEYSTSRREDMFKFLNDNPILGIDFSGSYTNVNNLENNWKPKNWIEL